MTKSYLSSVGISLKNTFQSFSCFHSLSLNLPSKQGSVLSFNVLWNDIVRSVVLHSCLWEPEKFSKLYKNGMDCSCAGFGVGLLSVHLYSGVFSGPSKTMDSTQFHVLFLYSAILPPEPKLEYRIGENILVPLFLNEITFCQHTLVACDGLCTCLLYTSPSPRDCS